ARLPQRGRYGARAQLPRAGRRLRRRDPPLPRRLAPRSRTLGEPRPRVAVVVDDGVLPRLEHEVEVPAVHRLLRPPAVDDAPLLAERRDVLPVHATRRAVGVRLHERGPGRVQSSRGTSSARVSGMRDHGATSTTVETPPAPTAARTWRRPSRSRPCSTSPSAATSSSCSPVCSASAPT